jgi:hypothetical protein
MDSIPTGLPETAMRQGLSIGGSMAWWPQIEDKPIVLKLGYDFFKTGKI